MPPDAILNKVIAERVAAQCKRLREELLHDEYQKRVKHSHHCRRVILIMHLLYLEISTSLCQGFGKANDARRQATEPYI